MSYKALFEPFDRTAAGYVLKHADYRVGSTAEEARDRLIAGEGHMLGVQYTVVKHDTHLPPFGLVVGVGRIGFGYKPVEGDEHVKAG